MSLKELRREMKSWQKRLGLLNWRIRLGWGVPVDGEPEPFTHEIGSDCLGLSWFQAESPNAVITLRRDQGVHTLIHELLHVLLEGHKVYSRKYDAQYERGLNHLTDCLVGKPDLTV